MFTFRPFTCTWPWETSWRAALRVFARPSRKTTLSSRVSKKLQQRFTGHTAFAQSALENAAELAFEQTVLIAKLLFFTERDRVIGLFAAGTFRSVHARRIIFSLESFRRSKEWHAIAAADFGFWSGISAHEEIRVEVKNDRSDAALFRRAATVVRNWRDVPNHGEIEADCLQRTHGGFAPAPGPRTRTSTSFNPWPMA